MEYFRDFPNGIVALRNKGKGFFIQHGADMLLESHVTFLIEFFRDIIRTEAEMVGNFIDRQQRRKVVVDVIEDFGYKLGIKRS